MRRIALAFTLVLAGCATAPRQETTEIPAPTPGEPRRLLGLTPEDLVVRFGNPAFQAREGSSLKLQFRSRQCVVDAYLYPSADGQMRVTHIDSRDRSGADADQAACVAGLENPI